VVLEGVVEGSGELAKEEERRGRVRVPYVKTPFYIYLSFF